jgi:hydroxyacylglutathione hydrolase
MINVHIVPVLSDNYAYVITNEAGDVGVIDPGEARPVKRFCDERGLTPNYIFLTHHHGDHTAGVTDLKETYGCQVIGPAAEAMQIPDMDIGVHEGHPLQFGEVEIDFIETPGHTAGQINFFFPRSKTLFSGDTLFVMGCGRVFEGTMEEMFHSLQKLKNLPDETKIYCGHEYTLANAAFARHADPDNTSLKDREKQIKDLRNKGLPTVPSTISQEKDTNPFLRAKNAEAFAKLRKEKDQF